MIRFLFAAMVLLPQLSFSQLTDSFSDGNFSSSPRWQGDTSAFIINPNLQLQSQGPTTSTSIYLSTPSNKLSNSIWEFWIQLPFSPSTSNYAKIYLSSDNANLKLSLNGYFIKVGGESGTGDGIDLYRQNGTTVTKIIDGISGHAGKSNNKLRIKISRDKTGNWTLYSDTLGGYNYLEEGKVLDSTFKQSEYAGLVYNYSSTRRNQFYFDDFTIKPAPLTIDKAVAINDSSLEINFNNNLDPITILNIGNYQLGDFRIPISAQLTAPSSIKLVFSSQIKNAWYSLEIKSIKDEFGNTITNQHFLFYFKAPLKYADIIISEIYPDPTPSNGLPDEEFVELYNASNDSVNLNGFKLSDLSTTAIIQNFILGPKDYLILTTSDGIEQYQKIGKSISLSPWPSLNNSADNLTLKDNSDHLLFNMPYTLEWYRDGDKSEGGWSLEIINPMEICKGKNDWRSSTNSLGGTPGQLNSVNDNKMDQTGPLPILSSLEDSSSLIISFDESITINSDNSFLSENNSILQLEQLDEQKIKLHWNHAFQENKEIIIKYPDLRDCLGNSSSGEIKFTCPGKLDSLDIIINEILFNPKPDGIDFVEIYNRSGDIIDLRGLSIASIKGNGQVLSAPISTESQYLYPQNYKVLCSSKELLQKWFPLAPSESIVEIHNFPSFNDDFGTATIVAVGKYIDLFSYNENYHSPLLKDKEGFSLERISFVAPTNFPGNWQSASALTGNGTPGYENSMHHENTSDKLVDLQPKVITPNGDLDKDQAYINFHFENAGNYCSIKIFNSSGILVKNLAENIFTGEQGFFIWDGTNDKGSIVETGIYLLFMEYFNDSGSKGKCDKTIVVYSDK